MSASPRSTASNTGSTRRVTRLIHKHPRRFIVLVSLAARLVAWTLVFLSAGVINGEPFDSSPALVSSSSAAAALPVLGSRAGVSPSPSPFVERLAGSQLRWDAIHFAHIAQTLQVGPGGWTSFVYKYEYEHEYAWPPGVPALMRIGAYVGRAVGLLHGDGHTFEMWQLLLGSAGLSILLDPSVHLYELTLLQLKSPRLALLAALSCAIGGTSPATWLSGVYTELPYTFFAIRGLIFCHQERWLWASFAFAFATAFRANGVLLAGFVAWGVVVAPLLGGTAVRRRVSWVPLLLSSNELTRIALDLVTSTRLPSQFTSITISLAKCLVFIPICISPFILHQKNGYDAFCQQSPSGRPAWCSNRIPSIYAHVQSHYWNVGFLRYWRPEQIPNFFLGAPPLIVVIPAAVKCVRDALTNLLSSAKPSPTTKEYGGRGDDPPQAALSLLPHALHALALSFILVFASHTQISLRVIPTLPFFHWAVAQLLSQRPMIAGGSDAVGSNERGKALWIGWLVVWWPISCVLWGAFLPPA
ncbi:hypothetical protein DL93DRAFT_1828914 [Clavulina sp. PMI_390]|nr:hypothetical protein DL93DRAFT_1828914 [Clavulina sp. PMI_390]